MDERVTTRAEFDEVVRRLATALGEVVWAQGVEQGKTAAADGWLRAQGGAMLRGMLGAAWTARSERLGVSGRCACGGVVGFRQQQDWRVHTILPGRDVGVEVQYGQCERCHRGRVPVLAEMRVDEKGFTEGLQELALLAGVMEPYQASHEELLGRFAGVSVSAEKIEALVAQEGQRAEQMLQAPPSREPGAPRAAARGPCYVGLDGEETERTAQWRTEQLDRLWDDRVEAVIATLRFLGAHQRSAVKRKAVEDLQRYLTTNQNRMRYRTFRNAGYQIGSGAAESAIGHVVQQRMKRSGMRWEPAGADAMLALRSVYRSIGAWDTFWRARAA